jgi:O-antigen biosynthesis protein
MVSRKKGTVLLLGYVWPELTSSAAGMREWNLINAFRRSADWNVIFSSAAKENSFTKDLQSAGIETHNFQANDATFDEWISQSRPDYVIFDRYIVEEQFGWRVSTHSPSTVRVLDTQDLHFLRLARQQALLDKTYDLSAIFQAQIPLQNENCLRELSSIYRCDLSLILSSFERSLLTSQFNIPSSLLCLSRFHYPRPSPSPTFSSRHHFCMIGNFRHGPNADGVRWLYHEIWPKIRQELPQVEMHVYGAYPPREMMDLTNTQSGFHVKGPVKNHFSMLRKYKLNLAPLRYGAGIKGKITDGWFCGTPVITTPIGSEGMADDSNANDYDSSVKQHSWGGAISTSDPHDFAHKAVELYLKEDKWNTAQANGFRILNNFHSEEINSISLVNQMTSLRDHLHDHRQSNFIGNILNFNTLRSTKYFSLWIEEKKKKK